MCGLIGFAGHVREGQWRQTHAILSRLFEVSEKRGRDATGFAALTSPEDHPLRRRVFTEKQATPASEFIQSSPTWERLRHFRCAAVIGHVRWATHGSPKDPRNNHPHIGGSGLFVCHNGVIHNHREIAHKYGLEIKSECDSEILLRLAEFASPLQGLTMALRECVGSVAASVLDTRLGVVWLAHNGGRSLWTCRLRNDRRVFFASTEELIVTTLRSVLGKGADEQIEQLVPVAAGYVHLLRPDGSFRSVAVAASSGDFVTANRPDNAI